MKIVVLVKYVPEPTATWSYADDLTLDRAGVDGRLSELDEYAVEQALQLTEKGLDAEIVYLTMGPPRAVEGVRKALSMGGTSGVHVLDDALHGSDAMATSLVLARALEHLGYDLVLTGMASTDAEMSVVPAMVAARLAIPQVTFAAALAVDATSVSVRRDSDTGSQDVVASLPALVSVTDQTGEARYPSFKGIMAGKKKPVQTLSLADLGIDPSTVGIGAAKSVTSSAAPRPPRQAGTVVVDEGDGAARIAEFLAAARFI
ncbi:MAG: electron transfer flavoprotein subunit beta/FixA family protein [Acidimicrobiales bacterium]|jgi:electron transfer flavoprotein beta subunit|nr:electron transfer flavoprotein subunit beta/FixA family protein [Acidimicrobiales bacterium]